MWSRPPGTSRPSESDEETRVPSPLTALGLRAKRSAARPHPPAREASEPGDSGLLSTLPPRYGQRPKEKGSASATTQISVAVV